MPRGFDPTLIYPRPPACPPQVGTGCQVLRGGSRNCETSPGVRCEGGLAIARPRRPSEGVNLSAYDRCCERVTHRQPRAARPVLRPPRGAAGACRQRPLAGRPACRRTRRALPRGAETLHRPLAQHTPPPAHDSRLVEPPPRPAAPHGRKSDGCSVPARPRGGGARARSLAPLRGCCLGGPPSAKLSRSSRPSAPTGGGEHAQSARARREACACAALAPLRPPY